MTFSRIAVAVAIALLTIFVVVVILAGHAGAGAAVVAFIAIAALVGAGNALYGRNSHGAKALARTRPAQEAHDRAADVAAEARRTVAEAERRGERFCPLDPTYRHGDNRDHADARHADHADQTTATAAQDIPR